MGIRRFGDYEGTPEHCKPRYQDLLGVGWQPLHRDFDLGFLLQLLSEEPRELSYKTLDLVSYVADALGRQDYAWWANIFNVFYESTRSEVDGFWDYITPEPPGPDSRYKDIMSTETPTVESVSQDIIPLEQVFTKLQEVTILKIVDLLGRPDTIIQRFAGRHFAYPANRFIDWNRIECLGVILAYWSQHQVWLQITNSGISKKRYTLYATDLVPLINKATYNLAVMVSGYQSRVGQIHSQYPIRTFPADIQSFTDTVQQAIFDCNKLAVLVKGEPGTGKTVWTQAIAKEIMVPLGYVIFILDHDAVEKFVPPNYLEQICIIINEADNLAKNRANETAQNNSKTERILSLLDGTLYQSIIDETAIRSQHKLVILMTCNTTERLDPAVLRKGRVDLTYEFTHRFV